MIDLHLFHGLILAAGVLLNVMLIEKAMDLHWGVGLTTLITSLVGWFIAVETIFGGAS